MARNGGIGVGLYCTAYAVAGALIGTAAHAFLPPLADGDTAFAQAVNAVLPGPTAFLSSQPLRHAWLV